MEAPAASAPAAAARAFFQAVSPRPATATETRPDGATRSNVQPLPSTHFAFSARTSAPLPEPKRRTRAEARAAWPATRGSSALSTAVASGGSPVTRSPFSSAISSRLPRCSMWAVPTLVMTPTVGRAMSTSREISPRWFIPSSTTTLRSDSDRRSRVRGRPNWLFRFPAFLRHGAATERIAAHISFVVVLPLLPVMATTGPPNSARCPCASAPSPRVVSSTAIAGRSGARPSGSSRPRSIRRPAAPAAAAWERKRCASWLGPTIATKSCPGAMARVSMEAPAKRASGSPRSTLPRVQSAALRALKGTLIGRPAVRGRAALPRSRGRGTSSGR